MRINDITILQKECLFLFGIISYFPNQFITKDRSRYKNCKIYFSCLEFCTVMMLSDKILLHGTHTHIHTHTTTILRAICINKRVIRFHDAYVPLMKSTAISSPYVSLSQSSSMCAPILTPGTICRSLSLSSVYSIASNACTPP